ncbi:MAG: Gfo/Idh/MocA family oxidoreductase [Candidatus Latescibacterota bacterium]|nr:Gfo/Idh/MocA family oxidoreductase [Candidatus Latescibacterota bacterium]
MSENRVQLALIGCGGIAGAHVRGLQELVERDVPGRPEIVACCDIVEDSATARAQELADIQGNEPRVYCDVDSLLFAEADVEACDICALHSQHHHIAEACFDAGRHVIIEKPLGITVRAAQRIIDAAVRSGCLLAVAENYRRSLGERATNWAVRSGRIGRPRLLLWQDVGEGLGKWGWRNFRMQAGGGWVLDGGVHFTDLFGYHLDQPARKVHAVTRQFEPYRYDEPAERKGAWQVDVEDLSAAIIEFEGGAVVQWTWSGSSPGEGFNRRTLYGSDGCIDWESGLWTRSGDNISRDDLAAEFRCSLSDVEAERLFPGGTENTFGIELKDFADAVRGNGTPEVDGLEGLRAQAVCMAVYESAYAGESVDVTDVEGGFSAGYQAEIDAKLGL